MSYRKHHRECIKACHEAGLNPTGIEHRGKHIAVVCYEGRLFCPSTPSDRRRFRQNLRRDARRLARR